MYFIYIIKQFKQCQNVKIKQETIDIPPSSCSSPLLSHPIPQKCEVRNLVAAVVSLDCSPVCKQIVLFSLFSSYIPILLPTPPSPLPRHPIKNHWIVFTVYIFAVIYSHKICIVLCACVNYLCTLGFIFHFVFYIL